VRTGALRLKRLDHQKPPARPPLESSDTGLA
jgi:hypothetical protein